MKWRGRSLCLFTTLCVADISADDQQELPHPSLAWDQDPHDLSSAWPSLLACTRVSSSSFVELCSLVPRWWCIATTLCSVSNSSHWSLHVETTHTTLLNSTHASLWQPSGTTAARAATQTVSHCPSRFSANGDERLGTVDLCVESARVSGQSSPLTQSPQPHHHHPQSSVHCLETALASCSDCRRGSNEMSQRDYLQPVLQSQGIVSLDDCKRIDETVLVSTSPTPPSRPDSLSIGGPHLTPCP